MRYYGFEIASLSSVMATTSIGRGKLFIYCNNFQAENDRGSFLQERDPLFLGPDLMSAPVVSCCGHMMHISCWNKHYENVVAKERRRPYR